LASSLPAVIIDTIFPNAEIFGVKLVNGQKNSALLTVQNQEPDATVKVVLLGAALWTLPPDSQPLRNLSLARANVEIPPGGSHRLEYVINTELHPQDLVLKISAIVEHPEGKYAEMTAFNEVVSIVEAPISIFDPQM
jgi:hypothetical protein